ncbi:MAG TPA: arginine deiminase family protein [Anaerolineales bacterium]|nr:arginine deiminase family protein [Anaerolineales bacterium]HMV97128.1 arginine deiminase family protein [Anaerolineales bacterium]HMX18026.1 arginine deiminase family protein [Anaerolineales bacterium]HMX73411.1 arginine deiminase family protein [Anaerolineales bacterium]HMZ42053.1 arginine deiminase family protein [Anaerolineales bacterium]
MPIAITRKISPRFNECEVTHIERTPIDLNVARAQHQEYVHALAALGCQVIELPEEPDLPDSVFVEDTAFILPEVAVITRPGADSRKPETESIIRALSSYRPLVHVTEPGTVDGGDVLVLGKNIYIGNSTRSNADAVRQIQQLLDHYGYTVTAVDMHDCLHLKTALTKVDDKTLLINPNWVDTSHFKGFDWIEVDSAEPFAANCLPVGDGIIFPTAFPKTSKKLEARGYKIQAVNVAELAKAEGAVTCCSLIV